MFTGTWKDITGAGASWSIRVPRVISDYHVVWKTIHAGHLPRLQRLLATREISPFDVAADGDTLLTVSLLKSFCDRADLIVENLMTGKLRVVHYLTYVLNRRNH